jgi:phosphatidylserine/phosphatidylglycerophosphate/cardiolipin synthase-like enzyme
MVRSGCANSTRDAQGAQYSEALGAPRGSHAHTAGDVLALVADHRTHAAPELVELLDGGEQAYPRMLRAIELAKRRVHLEVYAFAPGGIGARFIAALTRAAERGVRVQVLLDGWGSAYGGRSVAAALLAGGCDVRIYNRLLSLFIGRFSRNHRKILLVDDEVAFLGGINIGDENVEALGRPSWADLALEIRGPQCAYLGQTIRRERRSPIDSDLHIYLSGLGEGGVCVGATSRPSRAHVSASTSPMDTSCPTGESSEPSSLRLVVA